MKFEHYLKRVEESPEFKEFKKEHKKAYLCAGFFVLDFDKGKNIHQIDYFIPNSKKIATFTLNGETQLKISEPAKKIEKKLEKIEGEIKTDIDALKGIVHDEMLNRIVTQQITKIVAVLQSQKGKKIWFLSCITNDFGILTVHIDDESEDVLIFEKRSFFDFIRKM
ncbi:hypothetical protein HYT26_04645 [Candidatus Pacearchaeota archaeon]|nr:hypothetical protein [Candidatus Pacearchaeota archaeon]